MPAYTYTRFLVVDEDTGDPVANATNGVFLSNDEVAQPVYDLVGTPLTALTTGPNGVGSGFQADIPYGVVSFGSVALPVISFEAQSSGLLVLDAVDLAQAAVDRASAAQIAAETAAASVGAVPDSVADAAISRAITEGRVVGAASPSFTGTPTGITKTHVGLGNVDNTSDLNKPVSTQVRSALNELAFQDTATRTASYTAKGVDNGIVQSFDSALPVTLFVPTDLPARTYIPFNQWGTGQLTIAPVSSGATTAPSRRGSSVYVSGALTSHPIPMPAAHQNNDGILVLITLPSGTRTVTPPADFVQVDAMVGPSGAGQFMFRKAGAPVSDAGALKTFLTSGAAIPITAVAVSLADAHLTDFIDGFSSPAPDTATRNTALSYTTVADKVLELSLRSTVTAATPSAVVAVGPPRSIQPPPGLSIVAFEATNRGDANTLSAMAAASATVPAGTSIGSRLWPAEYGFARTVGIKGTVAQGASHLRSAGDAFKVAARYGSGAIFVRPDGLVLVDGYLTA